MSQLQVTMHLRDLFFDRAAVINAVDAAKRKTLSRIGAFVRRRARSKLRKRKRTSKPGEPPSIHSNSDVASLRNILFAYDGSDPTNPSVVIGPVRLNQVNSLTLPDGSSAIRGTIPQLMEFGGEARIFEWDLKGDGEWSRADRRFTRTLRRWERQGVLRERTRIRLAKYQPHPFMGPSLQEELPRIPKGFIGSVTAGF